jgi:hypothetical protein
MIKVDFSASNINPIFISYQAHNADEAVVYSVRVSNSNLSSPVKYYFLGTGFSFFHTSIGSTLSSSAGGNGADRLARLIP